VNCGAPDGWRVRRCFRGWKTELLGYEGVNRNRGGGYRIREAGALRAVGECRQVPGRCPDKHRCAFRGHGAVVSAMAAAAGRQAQI